MTLSVWLYGNADVRQIKEFRSRTKAELIERIQWWMDEHKESKCDGLTWIDWDQLGTNLWMCMPLDLQQLGADQHTMETMTVPEFAAFLDEHDWINFQDHVNFVELTYTEKVGDEAGFWVVDDGTGNHPHSPTVGMSYEEDPWYWAPILELWQPETHDDPRSWEEARAWAWIEARNDFIECALGWMPNDSPPQPSDRTRKLIDFLPELGYGSLKKEVDDV